MSADHGPEKAAGYGHGGAEAGPELSIVVVNWNTRDAVLECLESIRRASRQLALEAIVVDNGSPDGSAEAIAERFPEFRLIANRRNAGFARANNQAFRHCRGRYVLLLNPDTEARVESLRGLVEFMDRTPDAGAAGLQLRHPDGRRQNSFDSFPALATELLSKHLLRLLLPRLYPSKRTVPGGPITVDLVIGACLIVRPDLLSRLGGFDERFFLFVEEADLCRRIGKAGWKVYHLPHLDICHSYHFSKEQAPAHATIESYRSSYLFFKKHRSRAAYCLFRVLKTLKLLLISVHLSWMACLVTLGRSPSHRRKLKVRSLLALWHLLGCPAHWGMRQVSEFRGYRRSRREAAGLRFEGFVGAGLAPEAAALLQAGPGLSSPLPADSALKRTRTKTSFRVEVPGTGPALLTVYRPRGLFGALAARFGVPEGIGGFERALHVADQGIATPLPLAAGAIHGRLLARGSFLAFREIPGLEKLQRALERSRADPARYRAWVAAYGAFVRRLHDAGVVQRDLNPGNALAPGDAAPGADAILLVDLERVEVGPPLEWDRRIDALARLNRLLAGFTTSDRLRFLLAYLASDERPRRRSFVAAILDRMPALRRAEGERARRNCTRENWFFGRLRGGLDGHFRRRAYPWEDDALLDGPAAESLALRALGDGRMPAAVQVETPNGRGGLARWQEVNRAFQSGESELVPLVFVRRGRTERLVLARGASAKLRDLEPVEEGTRR
jgi:hypothetical protein